MQVAMRSHVRICLLKHDAPCLLFLIFFSTPFSKLNHHGQIDPPPADSRARLPSSIPSIAAAFVIVVRVGRHGEEQASATATARERGERAEAEGASEAAAAAT